MPQTGIPSGSAPQQPPHSPVAHEWKLWEKVLAGGVAVLALAIFSFAILGLRGSSLVPNELRDKTNALESEVDASPDIVVSTYLCDSSAYEWRVIKRDEVLGGSRWEHRSPSVDSYVIPVLMKNGQILYEGAPHDFGIANSNFPVAEPFIKAYAASRDIFQTGDPEGKHWSNKYYKEISFTYPAVSMKDFDDIAFCTKKYRTQIDADINIGTYPRKIGWLILKDSTERRKAMGYVAYACNDGSTGVIAGGRHIIYYAAGSNLDGKSFVSTYKEGGWVTLDGKIHPKEVYSPLYTGGVDPGSVIPQCVDSTGQSMVDIINSVPSRMQYMQ